MCPTDTRVSAPLVSLRVRDFHRTLSLVFASHPSSQAALLGQNESHQIGVHPSIKDTHPSPSHSLPLSLLPSPVIAFGPRVLCFLLCGSLVVLCSIRDVVFPRASGRVSLLMCYDTE